MSLPASGQISFNDVSVEMENPDIPSYTFGLWAAGRYGNSSYVHTPINVHSNNSGKYNTNYPLNLNTWHGYNRSANYASDGTNRSLFFSFDPYSCFVSSMIVFDVGTSNTTYDINISGSSTDFEGVSTITAYYGRPWQADGGGYGSATTIYTNNINGAALNTTVNYNYTYDYTKGQYVYVVIYSFCP